MQKSQDIGTSMGVQPNQTMLSHPERRQGFLACIIVKTFRSSWGNKLFIRILKVQYLTKLLSQQSPQEAESCMFFCKIGRGGGEETETSYPQDLEYRYLIKKQK